ncbi:MAG: CvpA family protein [Saprospiraceae bacterium]|nr:CvpA family protein [Saprospiraceae bacterium]
MIIDLLFIATVGMGFFKGFNQGIINTVFSVLSIVVALMAAFKLSPFMTEMLQKGFSMYNPFMFLVGFIVTFFLTKWLLQLVSQTVTGVLEAAQVNLLNQVIGAGILALVFSFIFSVLVWFADSTRVISDETKALSVSYRLLEPLRETGFKVLGDAKPIFQNFLSHADKMLDGVEKQRVKKTETKTDIYNIPDENAPLPPNNNTGQQ